MSEKQEVFDAYPLQWPVGYKRTPAIRRVSSLFKQNYETAQRFLHDELARMQVKNLIVSTNLRIRRDGLLYADEFNRKIDDPGAAIYFKYKDKQVSMCCDQYLKVWENLYALGKGIEALRGMERWGVSEFLDRAFTGFTALPESVIIPSKDIWEILELPVKPASGETVKQQYRNLAKRKHPDGGGSSEQFRELQWAYEQALSMY